MNPRFKYGDLGTEIRPFHRHGLTLRQSENPQPLASSTGARIGLEAPSNSPACCAPTTGENLSKPILSKESTSGVPVIVWVIVLLATEALAFGMAYVFAYVF